MIRRLLTGTLAVRIAIASLVVTSAAVLVIAVGVLVVSQSLFRHLIEAHGAPLRRRKTCSSKRWACQLEGDGWVNWSGLATIAWFLGADLVRVLDKLYREIGGGHAT